MDPTTPAPLTLSQALAMPKKEAHLHLGGSYPARWLQKMATPEQWEELESFTSQFGHGMDYRKGFAAFGVVEQIVNSAGRVMTGVYELCKWLHEDGVTHAEIRTGLKPNFESHRDDIPDGKEGYLWSVVSGRDWALEEFPQMKIDLVLSLRKNSTEAEARETFDIAQRFKHLGVTGVDISGPATDGDGLQLEAQVAAFAQAGFKVLLHMGEDPSELEGDLQERQLKALQPTRLGHCVHLTEKARQYVFEQQIPVELCMSSSMAVRMIQHEQQHPVLQMAREGHPVVICTDDPLLFNTSPSEERLKVARALGWGLSEMQELEERVEV